MSQFFVQFTFVVRLPLAFIVSHFTAAYSFRGQKNHPLPCRALMSRIS